MVAFDGSLSTSENELLPLLKPAGKMVTSTVLLVSPGANVRVPLVGR
jgi:hypothetical protein